MQGTKLLTNFDVVHGCRVRHALTLDQDSTALAQMQQLESHDVVQISNGRVCDLEVADVARQESAVKHIVLSFLAICLGNQVARKSTAQLVRTKQILKLSQVKVIGAIALLRAGIIVVSRATSATRKVARRTPSVGFIDALLADVRFCTVLGRKEALCLARPVVVRKGLTVDEDR